MTRLIEKNTTIPTSRKETFSTATDSQTSVTIQVLQGEREFARDNRTLGKFDLMDIPSAPRGMPQIEVEFAIDANGILKVSATDKATGKSQNIEISGSSGMSKDDIEQMKSDAETHAAEDQAKRELIELKNQAEQIVYATRKQLEEHGEKVDAEVRGTIESALSNLEEKVKGDDKAAIEAALNQVTTVAQELGKAAYEAAAQEQGASEGEAEEGCCGDESCKDGDDVIDAEYEVRDDTTNA